MAAFVLIVTTSKLFNAGRHQNHRVGQGGCRSKARSFSLFGFIEHWVFFAAMMASRRAFNGS
jgi:hypothetical protein